MELEKTMLVTHKNCMDGSTSAILFIAAGGLRENIRFTNPSHSETDEIVSELLETWSGPILIADVSVSVALAEKVRRTDVFLLDHHKSAIPLADFSWCLIDVQNTSCGSMMLYNYLQSFRPVRDYTELVNLVDDHDRWVKQYKATDKIASLHQVLGQEFFIDRFVKDSNTLLTSEEEYVVNLDIRKRDQYIAAKKKEVEVLRKTIQGHNVRVAFVSAATHQSQLGNAICEDPVIDADIAVMVGGAISMRARKSCPVDLSSLAKVNSGGGHKLAAGCSLDGLLGKTLVDFVKDSLKFN